jgi:hypothetical protein
VYDSYQESCFEVFDISLYSIFRYTGILGKLFERHFLRRIECQCGEKIVEFLNIAYSVEAR